MLESIMYVVFISVPVALALGAVIATFRTNQQLDFPEE